MVINGKNVRSVYLSYAVSNLVREQLPELPVEDFIDLYVDESITHCGYRPHHLYFDVAGKDGVPTGYLIPDQQSEVIDADGNSLGVIQIPPANHAYKLWHNSDPEEVYADPKFLPVLG